METQFARQTIFPKSGLRGFTGFCVEASGSPPTYSWICCPGRVTEWTELETVRRKPVLFPPGPLASIGIKLTRWSLARADRTGRRNSWLRVLDRLGLGFDS
jgi:hypothetical protein